MQVCICRMNREIIADQLVLVKQFLNIFLIALNEMLIFSELQIIIYC